MSLQQEASEIFYCLWLPHQGCDLNVEISIGLLVEVTKQSCFRWLATHGSSLKSSHCQSNKKKPSYEHTRIRSRSDQYRRSSKTTSRSRRSVFAEDRWKKPIQLQPSQRTQQSPGCNFHPVPNRSIVYGWILTTTNPAITKRVTLHTFRAKYNKVP